jgi:hypothetical protein
MSHPFFDAHVFPWERKEALPLYDMLVEVIDDTDEIVMLYVHAGGKRAALDVKQAAAVLWSDVLETLGSGQRLEALCRRLKAVPRLKQNAAFHALVDAVVNARAEMERQRFAPNVLVLDRAPLRDRLKLLAPASAPLRVLLVRGPPKTGKSWAKHVFQAAARDHGAADFYVYGGMVSTVGELIDELFAAIGAPPCTTDLDDSTDQASYGAVCRELQRAVMATKQPLWIAIDDVRDLDDPIREFCDQMAARMRTSAFAAWFRLMLINYPDRTLPTTWTPEIWDEDETADDNVGLEHVEAFLRELPGEGGRKLLEADIERIAKNVIAAADAPPPPGEPAPPRLQRVHDRLVQALEAEQ